MGKRFVFIFFGGVTIIFGFLLIESRAPKDAFFASLFYGETYVPEALHNRYGSSRLNILLVPGHTKESPGAVYHGTQEAELTVELAYYLKEFLQTNPRFHVSMLRAKNGENENWFSRYLEEREEEIKQFQTQSRVLMKYAVIKDDVTQTHSPIAHTSAADNTAFELYAVNKWANEHGIDIVLHIHFNDYPRKQNYLPGKYSGFSIYIPEKQLPNARVSKTFGESLKHVLEQSFASSDYPKEAGTVIETQELIAVGSNASRNGVSLLVEYGYIYEPQFHVNKIRSLFLKELAYQTYRGFMYHFEPETKSSTLAEKTRLLPNTWNETLKEGARGPAVLALQRALLEEGTYPPSGTTLNDCPLSGYLSACTVKAIKTFQEKYKSILLLPFGYSFGTGVFGSETRKLLNTLYMQ